MIIDNNAALQKNNERIERKTILVTQDLWFSNISLKEF